MNNREELDVIQTAIVRLRADLDASRCAVTTLMLGLPHAQQRAAIQGLQTEADQIEANFGASSSDVVKEGALQRSKALRTWARMLEAEHIRALDAQWTEVASQEPPPLTDPK